MPLTTEWLYYGMELDRHFVWDVHGKAERCFLTNANIPWGQQVMVMFQIVSTLMAEVPEFELVMRELQGIQPHIQA